METLTPLEAIAIRLEAIAKTAVARTESSLLVCSVVPKGHSSHSRCSQAVPAAGLVKIVIYILVIVYMFVELSQNNTTNHVVDTSAKRILSKLGTHV